MFQELQNLTWNAPGGVSPIVSECVTQAGFSIVEVVRLFIDLITFSNCSNLQVQVRKKEDQCTGSIWDSLPITEKEKDEINFAGLNVEVR